MRCLKSGKKTSNQIKSYFFDIFVVELTLSPWPNRRRMEKFLNQMNFKNIILKKIDRLGVLQINRIDQKNSLDIETSLEIIQGLKKLEKEQDINCIAIIGNEKIFSPGADIKELDKLNSKSARLKGLFNNFDKIEKIKLPIISLVEGHALGGGLELCLLTDFIIASSEAKFGQPEINLGLIPGIGGTQRLKKYIGKFNANYLCMSGNIINSNEAYEMGIVSKIIDKENFKKLSLEFAKKISEKPKSSLMELKKLISADKEIIKNIKKERKSFYELLDSDNKKIGIKSFFSKTKPIWKK
jgi:enoyl-CoA hydratase